MLDLISRLFYYVLCRPVDLYHFSRTLFLLYIAFLFPWRMKLGEFFAWFKFQYLVAFQCVGWLFLIFFLEFSNAFLQKIVIKCSLVNHTCRYGTINQHNVSHFSNVKVVLSYSRYFLLTAMLLTFYSVITYTSVEHPRGGNLSSSKTIQRVCASSLTSWQFDHTIEP
jgi:hypothetical protein